MRIHIEGIPLTDEMVKCLLGKNHYGLLKQQGCHVGSIRKYVDSHLVPDDFVDVIKAILSLPKNEREQVSIGFN